MFSIPGTAKLSLWSICLNVGWRLMLWGRKAWLLFIMFPGGFTDQYCCCSLCLKVFSLQICKNGIYPRWPGGWMFSQCEKLDPGPYSETKMWVDLWFLKKTLFSDYATAFGGWCRQEQGRCLWVLLLIQNTISRCYCSSLSIKSPGFFLNCEMLFMPFVKMLSKIQVDPLAPHRNAR